jgi:hypothetical protein
MSVRGRPQHEATIILRHAAPVTVFFSQKEIDHETPQALSSRSAS